MNAQARRLEDFVTMQEPPSRHDELVTLNCGCSGTVTWRAPGVAAWGVLITAAQDGCREHVSGRRKLISVRSVASTRARVTRRSMFQRKRVKPA
jgi:hypothetical protein